MSSWPLGLMILLFLTGMPIVLAVGFCSLLYIVFVAGVPLVIMPQQLMTGVDTFLLLAVPMFILAGSLMAEADVTKRLVALSTSLVGWMRGGLAQVNVMTSAVISGISGSALADAAATGSALIPAMRKDGYGAGFAAALTGYASVMGPVIPPSIVMVVIGGLTNISIGKMFLGGVIPGLLLGVLFAFLSYAISVKRNYPVQAKFSLPQVSVALRGALPSLGLPLIIIGGILSGVFTPTESAGVAAAYVIILGLVHRTFEWKTFYRSVVETGVVSGTVLFIIGVSAIFGWILVNESAADGIAATLNGITSDPRIMMLIVMGAFLLLGCLMEVLAVLILVVPVVLPVVVAAGVDPVHFGVVATVALSVGLVTPPFGLTMFLMCKLSSVSVEEFARESIPFFLCTLFALVLLILVPELVVWLPNLLMGAN